MYANQLLISVDNVIGICSIIQILCDCHRKIRKIHVFLEWKFTRNSWNINYTRSSQKHLLRCQNKWYRIQVYGFNANHDDGFNANHDETLSQYFPDNRKTLNKLKISHWVQMSHLSNRKTARILICNCTAYLFCTHTHKRLQLHANVKAKPYGISNHMCCYRLRAHSP